VPDESERIFVSWEARWRRESLEHFVNTKWSFLAQDSSDTSEAGLVGYFLAQPLIFFEGQAQSLWVEHLQFSTLQVRDQLIELAIRLAKENHFQRIYFGDAKNYHSILKTQKAEDWAPQAQLIKTTKV
jgi:hypothetical protein